MTIQLYRRFAVVAGLCFGVVACDPKPVAPNRPAAASEVNDGEAPIEQGTPADEPRPGDDVESEQVADVPAIKPARISWPDPKPADAGTCPEGQGDKGVGVLTSPIRPVAGKPLNILTATLGDESPLAVRLQKADADVAINVTYRPGVPSATIARLTPEAGVYTLIVGRGGTGLTCQKIRVRRGSGVGTPPQPANGAVWPIARNWSGAEEALYSAWVRELFHAEREQDLAFRRLDEVTSLPERNLLHNAFGWGEDAPVKDGGLRLKPDCADTPYFFRAYYAWKRRLPYGFRRCSRGSPGKAPRCGNLETNDRVVDGSDKQPGELGLVQKYLKRTLAWGVHTGNGRTALDDDQTDLYPSRLDRRGLRPGTVYADPYGHILVLTELIDPDGEHPGVLMAVDGQPDGSITRKRFWEGNFLWNPDPALGGAGFKNFRPVVRGDDGFRQLTNAEIAAHPDYGDVWTGHAELPGPAFYDRMENLITPGQRDPFVAQTEAVVALFEAAKVRVTSVQNGVDHHKKSGRVIDMPVGYKLFETTGPWESFSTPARDLRLLIAIDIVRGFADKVRRQPEVFGIPEGPKRDSQIAALAKKLDTSLATLAADEKYAFTYKRSDGSDQQLTLRDLLDRAEALEMAYNPNDCPEVRWGAKSGSDEMKTCTRRAPQAQRDRMASYRVWFQERRRPPRGATGP